MSAFLGPIHHWLFNKILIVEEREQYLQKVFAKEWPAEAQEVARKLEVTYGVPLGEMPLEELINDTPIHQWLSTAIEKTETREAAYIAYFLDKYGDRALELAQGAYQKHGSAVGIRAQEDPRVQPHDPKSLYMLLFNSLLDGMPCDHVTETLANNGTFEVKHVACLHEGYWKTAGAPFAVMCRLRSLWVDAFAQGVSENVRHELSAALARGDKCCLDVYRFK